jgi:Zn-dependent protease with chaperone function
MLQAGYFDGRTTRMQVVQLSMRDGDLIITSVAGERSVPFAAVTVDERLGSAARRLRFADGSFCEVRDLVALEQLLEQAGYRAGRVDRMQRRLQPVLLSLLACVVLLFAAYRWGLPWAASIGASRLPPGVGRSLSVQTLQALDGAVLLPTGLTVQRQQDLRHRYHELRLPGGGHPAGALLFRNSPQLGANAFTLPDGSIILLDDLVERLASDPQIMAVIAHELGHAHGHHGLQLLLQTSAVGAFLSFYVGDISQLLAAAPAVLVHARYSQELEQQADDFGAEVMLVNGMSPALLADALQKLLAAHPQAAEEGYLASHPATDARIRQLRQRGAADRY